MTAKDPAAVTAKKKGKGKLFGMAAAALLLLGGGGAAAGYWAAGSAGEGGHVIDPDIPQLVPHGEAASAGEGEGGGHGGAASGPPVAHAVPRPANGAPIADGRPADVSRYAATYYPIEAPFTSNLKDSDAFAQLSIGVATYYDSRVIDNLRAHEPAVRSAVLMRLAEQDPDVVATETGRTILQRELTQTINRVLREKTGFGGIDNVYFTSFVVQ
jgi:flagellar protein FliL